MSNSRRQILDRVRQNRPTVVELPSLDESWVTYDDPVAQFLTITELIGGRALVVADCAAAHRELANLAGYTSDAAQVSLVPGVGTSTIDVETTETPHELADLMWGVLPGELGVAENGAVWVTEQICRHRAIYFLCEHLVLVLPKEAIVHNMHQAYERLRGFGTDDQPPFGTMLAGPSKTADIEQSLVIGAQGPRSLVVFLVEDPSFRGS